MWPFKNRYQKLKKEQVQDAIYELEKQERLIEDLLLEKQEEIDHYLKKGKKEKTSELRLLYAKKIKHLKEEMQTDISKGSYLLYNIKLLRQLKEAIEDKEFFQTTTKMSLGNLLKDQRGLATFLNQALNTKVIAEDVLTTADETFMEIKGAYEPNQDIYGIDKNDDEILSVFDAYDELQEQQELEEIEEEADEKAAIKIAEEN